MMAKGIAARAPVDGWRKYQCGHHDFVVSRTINWSSIPSRRPTTAAMLNDLNLAKTTAPRAGIR